MEHDQVPELLREVALLRRHLDRIASGTAHPRSPRERRERIAARLLIIERSARRAQEIGGGVLIR